MLVGELVMQISLSISLGLLVFSFLLFISPYYTNDWPDWVSSFGFIVFIISWFWFGLTLWNMFSYYQPQIQAWWESEVQINV